MHCKSFDCVSEWKSIEKRRRRIAHEARVLLMCGCDLFLFLLNLVPCFHIVDTQQVETKKIIKDVVMTTSFI
jgi:hypothetical protein